MDTKHSKCVSTCHLGGTLLYLLIFFYKMAPFTMNGSHPVVTLNLTSTSTFSTTTSTIAPFVQHHHKGHHHLHSKDALGFIIPLLLTLLEAAAIAIVWWMHQKEARKPKTDAEAENIDNSFLCRDKNVAFEYGMTIRVGCPTPTFDCSKAFLDVELIGLDGERQGEVCRVDLSKLPNRVCGEVNFQVKRLLEMTPLLGIRAHHSDASGSIFLYELQAFNLKTGGTIEIRVFNLWLTNVPTIYEGKKLPEGALEEGYYPEVPTPPWNLLELVLIGAFFISCTCMGVSCVEHFHAYPIGNLQNETQASPESLVPLFRSLLDVTFIGTLMLTVMVFITLPYKYFLKKQLHMEKYSLVPADFPNVWPLYNTITLFSLLTITLLASAFSIVLGVYFTFTKSVYVWSATVVVCVCIFGSWLSGNESVCIHRTFETASQADVPADKLHGRSAIASPYCVPSNKEAGAQSTVLFNSTHLMRQKQDSLLATLLFGPTMANPKVKQGIGLSRKGSALVRQRTGKGSHVSLMTRRTSPLKRRPSPFLTGRRVSNQASRQTALPASHKRGPTSPAMKHQVEHLPPKVSRLVRPQVPLPPGQQASNKLGRRTSHGSLKRPPSVGQRLEHLPLNTPRRV